MGLSCVDTSHLFSNHVFSRICDGDNWLDHGFVTCGYVTTFAFLRYRVRVGLSQLTNIYAGFVWMAHSFCENTFLPSCGTVTTRKLTRSPRVDRSQLFGKCVFLFVCDTYRRPTCAVLACGYLTIFRKIRFPLRVGRLHVCGYLTTFRENAFCVRVGRSHVCGYLTLFHESVFVLCVGTSHLFGKTCLFRVCECHNSRKRRRGLCGYLTSFRKNVFLICVGCLHVCGYLTLFRENVCGLRVGHSQLARFVIFLVWIPHTFS